MKKTVKVKGNEKKIKQISITYEKDNEQDLANYDLDYYRKSFGDIIVVSYLESKTSNSEKTILSFEKMKVFDNWSLKILWYSEDYFTGWRKYVKRLSDWLLELC